MDSEEKQPYQGPRIAHLYSLSRPTPPDDLIEHLVSLVPQRSVAVDLGTGNGQVAWVLGKHFDRVLAIDTSQEQLVNAVTADNVEYRLGEAECIQLDARSVDLVTAAQAVHWFKLDRLYPEVLRVLRPRGVLAVWCYLLPTVNRAIDEIVKELYRDQRLYKHWPAWITLIENGYTGLQCLPDQEWQRFEFEATKESDLDTFLGFLNTWVAVQNATNAGDQEALSCLVEAQRRIAEAWEPATTKRRLCWKIYGATVCAPTDKSGQGSE